MYLKFGQVQRKPGPWLKTLKSAALICALMLCSCGKESTSGARDVSAGAAATGPVFVKVQDLDSLFKIGVTHGGNGSGVSVGFPGTPGASTGTSTDPSEGTIAPGILVEIRNAIVQALSLYKGSFLTNTSAMSSLVLEKVYVIPLHQEARTIDLGIEANIGNNKSNNPLQPQPGLDNPCSGFLCNPIPGSSTPQNGLPGGFSPCNGDHSENSSTTAQGTGAAANVNIQYVHSNYLLRFGFMDKEGSHIPGAEADSGQEIILNLEDPLEVFDFTKLKTHQGLSVDILDKLPKSLAQIVAQFFNEISLSVSHSSCWDKTETVSPRMFYKGNSGSKISQFTADLARDIVLPLCEQVMETRGRDKSACHVAIPAINDPVTDIKSSIASDLAPMSLVRSCESTDLRTSLLAPPVYKLYLSVPESEDHFLRGQLLTFFHKVRGGWQKSTAGTPKLEGEVLGTVANRVCAGKAATDRCYLATYSARNYTGDCKNLTTNGTRPEWGLSDSKETFLPTAGFVKMEE